MAEQSFSLNCPEALSAATRRDYDVLLAGLLEFQNRPEIRVQSNYDDRVEHSTFKRIVGRGDEFLPLILRTLDDGHYEMLLALELATGVEDILGYYYPDLDKLDRFGATQRGDRFLVNLWLMWWRENQLHWCGRHQANASEEDALDGQ